MNNQLAQLLSGLRGLIEENNKKKNVIDAKLVDPSLPGDETKGENK